MFNIGMDILIDSLYETLALFPYLFLTYLALEFLEHKTSRKTLSYIKIRFLWSGCRRIAGADTTMRFFGRGSQPLCDRHYYARHADGHFSLHFRRDAADFDFRRRRSGFDCTDFGN